MDKLYRAVTDRAYSSGQSEANCGRVPCPRVLLARESPSNQTASGLVRVLVCV